MSAGALIALAAGFAAMVVVLATVEELLAAFRDWRRER